MPKLAREHFNAKRETQVLEGFSVLGDGESHDLRNSHSDDCKNIPGIDLVFVFFHKLSRD